MSSNPIRVAVFLLASLAPTLTAAAGQAGKPAAAQKLPPLSYVCPMPQDADVIEDKPGSCPKCGMTLVPVRLDAKYWCPVHQALEVHDGPGKCRRDGRDLVPVTLAVSWTCADAPDKKLTDPGTCADGSERKIGYELRAHGDHNPRHGGQFFMASDAWHHIEGTYPENGLFRVFFYDNFTKPLPLRGKGIIGTLVIRDAKDKEIASVPLALGKNASTMEAKVPAAAAALPLRATVKMKFGATIPEQPFDFQFNELTKDTTAGAKIGPTATPRPTAAPEPPKPATPATTASGAAAAAPASANRADRPASQPPAPAPSAAPPAPAAPSSQAGTPAASGAPPAGQAGAGQVADRNAAPGNPPDLYAGEIAPMPPALAAVLNEDVLPKDVPGLLAELTTRAGQIDSLMQAGNISEVWLPAMGTKTVALVLVDHAGSLPAAQRAAAESAAKRVVAAAWEIDGYGDLGNRAKVVDAYNLMTQAVADLKGAYEGAR